MFLAVDDTGGNPLVSPEKLLFLSRLRLAKLERPRWAEAREISPWKGKTVALSKGERFEFETACPSNWAGEVFPSKNQNSVSIIP